MFYAIVLGLWFGGGGGGTKRFSSMSCNNITIKIRSP